MPLFLEQLEKRDKKLAIAVLRMATLEKCLEIADVILEKFNAILHPLELALLQGDANTIESFLSRGERFKGPEWEGFFPWFYIFRKKDNDTCKSVLELLSRYSLTAFWKFKGQNLMHVLVDAAGNSDLDIVQIAEIIADSGVPVDDEDHYGTTPLVRATHRDEASLVKFLIRRGADVNHLDIYQQSPLLVAIIFEKTDLIDFFLSSGIVHVNAITSHNATTLNLACHHHCKEVIKLLLRRGADVNVEGDHTPFSILNSLDRDYDECVTLMVRELAKRKFENLPISDLARIQKDLTARKHFENCLDELGRMSSKHFYGSYSHYSVLKMTNRIEKLAKLTKNEKFVKKFELDLATFPYYEDDLRWVLKEAITARDALEMVEYRLNQTFGTILPDLVKSKLAKFLTVEDLPLTE